MRLASRIIHNTDSRYKMPAPTRKFSGRTYHYFISGTKAEVEKDKVRVQSHGILARIVKIGNRYALYTWRGGSR